MVRGWRGVIRGARQATPARQVVLFHPAPFGAAQNRARDYMCPLASANTGWQCLAPRQTPPGLPYIHAPTTRQPGSKRNPSSARDFVHGLWFCLRIGDNDINSLITEPDLQPRRQGQYLLTYASRVRCIPPEDRCPRLALRRSCGSLEAASVARTKRSLSAS